MFRRTLLQLGLTIVLGCIPTMARAEGYTVYIKNTKAANSCLVRSGFAHDVYTSWNACNSSIEDRKAWNKRNGYDTEAFYIVKTSCNPSAGCLANTRCVLGQPELRYSPPASAPAPQQCYWYAKVYYNGRFGYLGGYPSRDAAWTAALNWVRGVGRGASFAGEVFRQCN